MPQTPYPQTTQPVSAQDEQLISAGAHIGGLLTSFVIPLILWVIFRERSTFAQEHARRALNWQILLLPAWVGAAALALILPIYAVAGMLQLALFIASAIFCIPGALAAYQRRGFRYPVDAEIVHKP